MAGADRNVNACVLQDVQRVRIGDRAQTRTGDGCGKNRRGFVPCVRKLSIHTIKYPRCPIATVMVVRECARNTMAVDAGVCRSGRHQKQQWCAHAVIAAYELAIGR